MQACLDENALVELAQGTLPAGRLQAALLHLDSCGECRSMVGELAPGFGAVAPAGSWTELHPGSLVGRYRVKEALGAGAMGLVFAAHDPHLGRDLALKLLRGGGEDASRLRERLLREARLLARLSHPNVVAVHDVGTLGDQIFVALALVDGGTLSEWLRAAPRTVPEILAAFRQAGEGLCAAHELGLVHRDFKPDNVLVGKDGRVRVTDFGLAVDAALPEETFAAASTTDPSIPLRLTSTGALIGTPAYMAPEQLEGGKVDARSDQFGFCVALYEALYGERPFAATDLAGLKLALLAAQVRPVPSGSRVPTWLRRILLRGLSLDPAARFPTVRALLDALDRGPLLGRRSLPALGLLVLAAALFAYWVRPDPCRGGEALWSPPGRAQSGPPEIEQALSGYRAAFLATFEQSCRAARERGEESEAVLGQRVACLSERRAAAAGLSRALSSLPTLPPGAPALAAAALPPIDECARASALAAPPPPSGQARARLEDVEASLFEARTLGLVGEASRGAAVAKAALAEAEQLGYRPLIARAALASAAFAEGRAREAALHRAAAVAISARDDATAADAFTALLDEVAVRQGRADEAAPLRAFAEAAIGHLPGDAVRKAALDRVVAKLPPSPPVKAP